MEENRDFTTEMVEEEIELSETTESENFEEELNERTEPERADKVGGLEYGLLGLAGIGLVCGVKFAYDKMLKPAWNWGRDKIADRKAKKEKDSDKSEPVEVEFEDVSEGDDDEPAVEEKREPRSGNRQDRRNKKRR